jgi:hypothetical protein
MAIAKLQERIGKRDVFLAFDSLTSPYLFNEEGSVPIHEALPGEVRF